jgi:hypothetical protein
MKSFDQILKEGKDKAKTPDDGAKKWRECINLLMETLHTLNDMYDTTDKHQIKIKPNNCKECGAASFIIMIRDILDRERIIRFHRGRWITTEDNVYYCEKCKKGK